MLRWEEEMGVLVILAEAFAQKKSVSPGLVAGLYSFSP